MIMGDPCTRWCHVFVSNTPCCNIHDTTHENVSDFEWQLRSNKAVPRKWQKRLLHLRLPGRGSVKIYSSTRHFGLSLLSSSRTPIWFKCSPPVLRLACKISLSSESAFCQHFMSKFTRVPSNRHEWTPRRFWFTIPDGTGVCEPAHHCHSILDWEVFIAAPPLRFG